MVPESGTLINIQDIVKHMVRTNNKTKHKRKESRKRVNSGAEDQMTDAYEIIIENVDKKIQKRNKRNPQPPKVK